MNNFYTITVYEKGAELIRMIAQMAGRQAFTDAVKHYLHKHDGQAVTIEDFVVAMEQTTGLDLVQFRHWYSHAGTPRVTLTQQHENNTLTLTLSQSTPATPGQPDKPVFDIPISLAVFDTAGNQHVAPQLVRLNHARQQLVYNDVPEPAVVSALRGLSAPVKLTQDTAERDRVCLMAHDSDPVSRWDAAQSLYMTHLVACVEAIRGDRALPDLGDGLCQAIDRLLADWPADRALLAEMLNLPSTVQIGEAFERIDVSAIADARRAVRRQIGSRFEQQLTALATAHAPQGAYIFDQDAAGRRAVFGLALGYLAETGVEGIEAWCRSVYDNADNMTDRMAALGALQYCPGTTRDQLLDDFAQRFADEPLVMDKWLRLQVSAPDIDAVARARALLQDPAFDFTNPNRLRALLGGLVRGNAPAFHRADGAGYALLVDEILRIDAFNPQMAAALAGLIAPWQRYDERYGQGMRAGLARLDAARLSDNTREIVASGLADVPA